MTGVYAVNAGDVRYATSLPLMFDYFSGWQGEARSFILNNAGTIWNSYPTESTVLWITNWGWIYNSGTIAAHSANGQAIALLIESTFTGGLINSGSIYAFSDSQGATAIRYWDPSASIQNSGTIAAQAPRGGFAIAAMNGGEIINHAGGSILAEGGTSIAGGNSTVAIYLGRGHWQQPGFVISGVDVSNHGRIEAQSTDNGQNSLGISANNIEGESLLIENSGVIRADVAIYSSPWASVTSIQHAPQAVTNAATGLIQGRIDLSFGNDLLVNNGAITGLVDMGGDHDFVINLGTITGDVALGSGNDVYAGAGGVQNGRVLGQDGADLLIGTAGADNLDGGAGDDILIAGGGDTLTGGSGRDTFVFSGHTSGQQATITDFTSGVDVIDLRLLSPTSATINGSTITVVTVAGNLFIQVSGTVKASDILVANASPAVGTASDDSLFAGAAAAHLQGLGGIDLLVGSAFNDVLDGGAGDDVMWGGAGDDLYVVDANDGVDSVGDAVFELPGHGTDSVQSSVSFTLPANVENLTLTGSFALDGAGNGLANVIVGNVGANILSGGAGNDVLDGAAGEDQLRGGAGDDVLTGGAGADVLVGGAGDDTFRDTASGLNGDTITDFVAGDKIIITDANATTFAFSMSGNTLTYTGGSLTLGSIPSGQIVARAAAAGGVELMLETSTVTADARNDFNGDGRSDVLWRHDDGTIANWLATASGGFEYNAAAGLVAVSNDWHVVGTGDFNGDGRDDVLWRNNDGTIANELATASGGFQYNAAAGLFPVSNDWHVEAPDSFFARTTSSSTIMMAAAVAAAGLAAMPAAAKSTEDSGGEQLSLSDTTSLAAAAAGTSDLAALAWESETALSGETQEAFDGGAPSPTSLAGKDALINRGVDAPVVPEAAQPTALLQGTEVPAAGNAAVKTLVAEAVVMPSAEMLQAIDKGGFGSSLEGTPGAQATAEVARVLVDALAGGDPNGPNLDALLDAVGAQPASAAALAQVAGHSAWAGGFEVAIETFSIEAFIVHQDALPQA